MDAISSRMAKLELKLEGGGALQPRSSSSDAPSDLKLSYATGPPKDSLQKPTHKLLFAVRTASACVLSWHRACWVFRNTEILFPCLHVLQRSRDLVASDQVKGPGGRQAGVESRILQGLEKDQLREGVDEMRSLLQSWYRSFTLVSRLENAFELTA